MSSPGSRLASNIFELQPLEIRRLLTTAALEGSILHIVGTTGADSITVNKNSSGRITITGVTTQFTPGSQFNQILIEASSGNDTVLITSNVKFSNGTGIPCTLAGNDGNDTLTGGPGNDVLSGGAGDDVMDGGTGNDLITGGPDTDTANYSNRTGAIRVTLDGLANDGEVGIGEADNVQTEEVIGGAGNDTIIGSSLGDFLAGGAGADSLVGGDGGDQLTGSSGSDQMYGQNGNDFLLAQNNDRDTVSGGTNTDGTPDLDLASIDTIDVGGAVQTQGQLASPDVPTAADGSALDPSYGTEGKAIGQDLGWNPVASAVDSQGRVYFVGSTFVSDPSSEQGSTDFAVVRFTPDGQLDDAYGQKTIDFSPVGAGPINYDQAMGVTVDSNDNVIVFGETIPEDGYSEFAVARLTPAGDLDSTFNGSGTQIISFPGGFGAVAQDAAVQADGKIVLVGTFNGDSSTDFAVARLLDNGQLDDELNDGAGNFNGTGTATLDVDGNVDTADNATAVAFQSAPSGGGQPIIVGGEVGGNFAIARFNPDGSLDSSFGDSGTGAVITDFGAQDDLLDLAVTSADQIVAVGSSSNVPILTVQGAAPATAALDTTDAILAVYSPNGSGAPSFLDQPPTSGSDASFNAVQIDAKGRIIVAGTDAGDFALARYNSDLSVDTTFANGIAHTDFSSDPQTLNQDDLAVGLRVLSDGRIVAGGTSDTTNDSTLIPVAARYVGEGAPPNNEGEVTGIEEFISYDDLHANPPPPIVQQYLDQLSPSAQLYQLSQPDGNGVARIDLSNNPLGANNNNVTINTVTAGDGTKNIAVSVDGMVLYYDASTTTRIEINTGAGNDTITAGCDVNVPLRIDAGSGDDRIIGGGGDDMIFGGTGCDFIDGAGGNDVIVGGDGRDLLYGSAGNDILIGGRDEDLLIGGLGEDIQIAGTTSYDSNPDALSALIAEWGSNKPNATRISDLRTGAGLNAPYLLTTGPGATVFDDAATDLLTNDFGRDWFFYSGSGKNHDVVLGGTFGQEVSPL